MHDDGIHKIRKKQMTLKEWIKISEDMEDNIKSFNAQQIRGGGSAMTTL